MEYTNSQIGLLIDEYIHSARDREIMKRRLVDGVRFEPLAEEFDISVIQAKRIVKREKALLFSKLI